MNPKPPPTSLLGKLLALVAGVILLVLGFMFSLVLLSVFVALALTLGAWFFVQHYIHENMVEGQRLGYSGRAASASPAVGYSHLHNEQQKALVEGAFGKLKGFVLTK